MTRDITAGCLCYSLRLPNPVRLRVFVRLGVILTVWLVPANMLDNLYVMKPSTCFIPAQICEGVYFHSKQTVHFVLKCFINIYTVCACVCTQGNSQSSLVLNRLFPDIKEEPGHEPIVHPR